MMIQFLQIAKDSVNVAKEIETVESVIKSGHADLIIDKLVELSISAGKTSSWPLWSISWGGSSSP